MEEEDKQSVIAYQHRCALVIDFYGLQFVCQCCCVNTLECCQKLISFVNIVCVEKTIE